MCITSTDLFSLCGNSIHCIWHFLYPYLGFREGTSKESACSAGDIGDQVILLDQEDHLEEATHSSTLAWRISWTEEPGRLWFIGL